MNVAKIGRFSVETPAPLPSGRLEEGLNLVKTAKNKVLKTGLESLNASGFDASSWILRFFSVGVRNFDIFCSASYLEEKMLYVV